MHLTRGGEGTGDRDVTQVERRFLKNWTNSCSLQNYF